MRQRWGPFLDLGSRTGSRADAPRRWCWASTGWKRPLASALPVRRWLLSQVLLSSLVSPMAVGGGIAPRLTGRKVTVSASAVHQVVWVAVSHQRQPDQTGRPSHAVILQLSAELRDALHRTV